MSITVCEHCGDLVDSDDDPDCFVQEWAHPKNAGGMEVICETCRDELEIKER